MKKKAGECDQWNNLGKCSKGDKCPYVHDNTKKGQPRGRSSSPSIGKGRGRGRAKSTIRSRSASPASSTSSARTKTRTSKTSSKQNREACVNWKNGSCKQGDKCMQWHASICKYVLKMTCTRGGSCPFLHTGKPTSTSPAGIDAKKKKTHPGDLLGHDCYRHACPGSCRYVIPNNHL